MTGFRDTQNAWILSGQPSYGVVLKCVHIAVPKNRDVDLFSDTVCQCST